MIKIDSISDIISYFNQTLQDEPEVSEAVAAIRTLIEYIKLNPGE